MNNTIVGMGEVLWDMLPEGKQLGGARLILLTMLLSSGSIAGLLVLSGMIGWETRSWKVLTINN